MHTFRMLASVIGLTIVLLASLAHAGSFIIELHNGREITTSRVWEEGDELKFAVSAGTAGLPRAQVKRIKTSPIVHHDKVARSPLSQSLNDAGASTTSLPSQTNSNRDTEIQQNGGNSQAPNDKQADGEKRLADGDVQSERAKKLTLTSALDAATNTYLEASAARNPDAKKAALDDMREYSKKIIELGDEVKKKHGGALPAWWDE